MVIATTDQFKQFEYRGWQQCVRAYNDSFSPLTGSIAAALLDAVDRSLKGELLDLACGPGHISAAAAKIGWDVVGADFSEQMLEQAQHNYPEIEFVHGDAEALDFESNRFDALVMNFGILHFAQPEQAIAEAFRVLSPGGRFAFTAWDKPSEALGFSIILKAVEKAGDPTVTLPAGPPFFRYSDNDEAKKALLEVGFSEFRASRQPLLWELADAEELFDAYLNGTARTGGLLRAQPDDALAAIKAIVIETANQQFADGGKLKIPMPAWIYSGTK